MLSRAVVVQEAVNGNRPRDYFTLAQGIYGANSHAAFWTGVALYANILLVLGAYLLVMAKVWCMPRLCLAASLFSLLFAATQTVSGA